MTAIHAGWPLLAGLGMLYDPNVFDSSDTLYAFTSSAGYELVFATGVGDCEAGCIDHDYYYFETDESCQPVAAGEYRLIYSTSYNCYYVVGAPRWGIPTEDAEIQTCTDTGLPPGLNEDCLDGMCPLGLTATTYVPVSGSEMTCMCTISCADDPNACPAGTSCFPNAVDIPPNLCL